MLEVLTFTSFDISLIYIPTGQIVACISPIFIRVTLHKHLSLHIKNANNTRKDAVPADVRHVDVKLVFSSPERRKDEAISTVDSIAESVRPICQIRHAIPFFYPAQGSGIRNSAVNAISAIIRVVLLQKYLCLGLVLANFAS